MANSFDAATLAGLIGKVLRIYKGGPESKLGKLVGMNGDYLLVDTENEGVIYYNIQHIKSLVEDLKGAPRFPDRPADFYTRYLAPLNLNAVLTGMKYEVIRVDRGGPESRVGRLVAIGTDYFVILTKEDGLLIYQTQHVRSITEEPNQNSKPLNTYPGFVEAATLAGVYTNLHNYWIKINRGGPESVEGVLSDNSADHIVLVKNKEIFRIASDHIRNFSYQDPSLATPDDAEAQANGGGGGGGGNNDEKKKGVTTNQGSGDADSGENGNGRRNVWNRKRRKTNAKRNRKRFCKKVCLKRMKTIKICFGKRRKTTKICCRKRMKRTKICFRKRMKTNKFCFRNVSKCGNRKVKFIQVLRKAAKRIVRSRCK